MMAPPLPGEHDMTAKRLLNRRRVLQAAGVSVLLASGVHADEPAKPKGNLKQSICAWCYKMPLEQLSETAKKIGYQSIELLDPKQILTVKKLGLTCSIMRCTSGIVNGTNRKENHDKIVKELHDD